MSQLDSIQDKSKHGGAREGAGRKKGSCTAKTREIADAAISAGITPLEFMLEVMRDSEADPKDRMDAAKSCAPYIHPRLTSVQMDGDVNVSGELDFRQIIVNGVKPSV
jgi:hypothetical protein